MSFTVEKKGILLNNQYVVPHNRYLIKKFNARINVELWNYYRSIKYLFKYVHKSSDRVVPVVEGTHSEGTYEIKAYVDCRYISATEA